MHALLAAAVRAFAVHERPAAVNFKADSPCAHRGLCIGQGDEIKMRRGTFSHPGL